MSERTYIAIDLKSFYASVECVERGINPLDAFLVVADESRTEKTICLAVTPALKAYGISGRARLFEVVSRVKEVNNERRLHSPYKKLSDDAVQFQSILDTKPDAQLSFIIAKPRMRLYELVSAKIVSVYLKYVSPEDLLVYSIDEVFIDVTEYLKIYHMTARELADRMVRDVLAQTGITATAGIGTNLYLAKIAMDIDAKHIEADRDGVRISELNELSYRKRLWDHRPLTDFWRIGRATAKKLEKSGMFTMGDVARCSIRNEDFLYKMFGKNAELLIDHAWGWEPCTIADVRAYTPSVNSLSSGQVLTVPYTNNKARLIIKEMTDSLVLDLVKKRLVTDQIVLYIGYDIENLADENQKNYHGDIHIDYYGRKVPKPAHSSVNLGGYTSSTKLIIDKTLALFDSITDKNLLVRRINVAANHIIDEHSEKAKALPEQLDLFSDISSQAKHLEEKENSLYKERQVQEALISIKTRFGKNGILKGMNLEEGATARERNAQIGGHKA
ncbi:MAG: DNA methylase [Ruminococcus sp.]|nr:DNA methylase [Ruminococcus sp.]